MEKSSQFEGVVNVRIALQKIAEQVQRKIANVVDWSQRTKRHVTQLPVDPTVSKVVNFRKRNQRNPSIPQADVHLDCERHLRIVAISTPLPALKPSQRWRVIANRIILRNSHWFIADRFQRIESYLGMFPGGVEINISLHAKLWRFHKIGRLRKALQHYMRNAGLCQSGGGFAIRRLDTRKSPGNICKIFLKTLLDPLWIPFTRA